ncbi:MAG: ABC transporter permease [Erysipelotrichaceae bacterium]|jgi:peptide/nickel transport system permease protein
MEKMKQYIIRRLGATVIVILAVSFISFIMLRLTPGNPALMMLPEDATIEQIKEMEIYLGLDKPLYVQYIKYIANVLKGDLGTSLQYKRPCLEIIMLRFPNTLILAITGVFLGMLIAIPLGVTAGVYQGSMIDLLCVFFSMIGQSLSAIVLGLLLVMLFSVKLDWLPSQGTGGIRHLILPALTIALPNAATLTRMARSGMVDVLKEDYITATYARGISKEKVYMKYALKNALIPVITMVGMSIANYMAGAVITENIFNWPGIGTLTKDAISFRDYPLVQAVLLLVAATIAIVNLLVDIINSFVDRRMSVR